MIKHLCSLALIASFCQFASAYDFEVDGIYYNILSMENRTVDVTNNTFYVEGEDEDIYPEAYVGIIIIPQFVTYNGVKYTVENIGEYAFSNCPNLTNISISESVKNIKYAAFQGCLGLTSIIIPNSVTSIESEAFSNCTHLTSINIPNSVTTIENGAFYGCTSLPVLDGLRYADTYLIETVDKTQSFYMIKGDTRWINDFAFSDCINLENITIPNSVVSIASNAFQGCISLPIYNGIRYADSFLVEVVDKTQASYSIKSGTRWMGVGAFSDCVNLRSITIPNGVQYIPLLGFWNCPNLESIYIPSSVTCIENQYGEEMLFKGCNNLSSIIIAEDNPVYDSRNNCNAIIETATNSLIRGCNNSIIPDGVATIEWASFYGCKQLTSIYIPTSVKVIETAAFSGCTALRNIILNRPEPISISRHAFSTMRQDYSTKEESIARISFFVPVGSVELYKDYTQSWIHKPGAINEIPSLYDNVLYVSGAEAHTTTSVSIPINMKNGVMATGYSFTLVLPEELLSSSVTLKKSTERKEDEMSFTKAVQADGSIKVVCYSTDGQPFEGNDGEVATLTFTVPADMEMGDYPIIIKDAEIAENNIAHKIPNEMISRLRIENYLLGDANMDGDVSVTDLSCIVNYLLNLEIPETFYKKAADANEDEDVSVSDLHIIVNIILYGNPNGANGAKARGERSAAECLLSAAPFTITPGEEAILSLLLSSDQVVTAFQFDAVLPDGLTCTNARRSSLVSEEHSFRSASLEDDLTRIVCYSGSNATFSTNEGTVAELTLKADKNLLPGLYALNLQNAEVVSLNGSAKLDGQSITFEVVAPMGIEMLDSEHEDIPRYDLMGHRIHKNNASAVYIEHGKKIIVK